MSVSSSVRGVTPFVGDGTTATFAFTFKVTGTGDLLVQSELVSTGVFTTLALATDYTVTLNANQELSPGGSITLVAGNLASGRKLYIQSALSGTQGASLKSYGGYSPKVVEAALDRGSMYALDTRAIANRAVLSPLGESGIALPSSTARASKMFAFDGSGNVDVSRSLSAFDSSVSAAATSAYNAATSASNAANSAASSSIAAVSASTAAVSASTAAVSASTAAVSASTAAVTASAAASSVTGVSSSLANVSTSLGNVSTSLASQLTRDTSNIYPDPEMLDVNFLGGAAALTAAGADLAGTAFTGCGQQRLRITSSESERNVTTAWFPVDPSTAYTCEVLVSRTESVTPATGSAFLELGSMNSAGAATLITTITVVNASNNQDQSDAARTSVSFTTGSTIRRARFVFRRHAGVGDPIIFGRPELRGAVSDAAVSTSLGNVSTSLGNVSTSLSNQSTSNTAQSTSIANISTSVAALSSSITPSLANVSTSTANAVTSLGNVSTSLSNVSTSLANQSTSNSSQSTSLTSISTSLGNVSTSLANVSTSVALVSGSFRTLASFGAVQDGVSGTDDASALNTALASGAVFIDGGNRVSRIGSALTFNASNTILRNFTLAPNQRTESSVFTAGALTLGTVTTLTASVALGASTLNLASLSGIVAGDLIRVTSQQPNAILRDTGGAVHGHTAKVTGVSGNQVFLAKALPWSIVAAESVTSITVSGGVATVTTAAAHGITSAKATIGEWPDIVIAGATGGDAAEYNKTQRITSVPTTTTFTFNTTAAAGATGTLTWSHTHTVQRLTGQVKNSTLQFDVDGAALNPSYAIASVTRGATTTFNAPGHDIAVGNVVIFQGPAPVTPGGTDNCTALRGATGTVTAVSGDNITTDINSTSFTDYTVANSARIVRRCSIVIALENIENCRVHINYRNGTGCGAAVRVGSSYDSDITITTDGMGTAFHPDAWFSYCTGGTHVAKSARAAGFGPQWADTSFVTVVGPESSSADHGRALKFSRFCRNTVIGGNGVNPRFNCVALAWGSRDNTFVGVNAFGSQRVSAQNGGIWSSDGDNTNNTLIGCNAEGNTTSDLSINGDSGWVIIGGNYGVISLSGIASSTTTLMTKKRFEMPQLASMILTGNNVVKLRDVNGFPLAIYGSNGAGGIDDTKPVYWGNSGGAGAIWSVDGFKAQWQAGAAPSEQTSMVLLYQSGGVQKYSRVLLGPDNGGFKELRVAT